MKPKVYSVSRISSYLKELVEEDMLLSGLFIEGEISNFTQHSNGHIYFTLKDEDSAIRAIMFKNQVPSLRFEPKNSTKVVVYGNINLYPKTGAISIIIEDMQEIGRGEISINLQALKQKLNEQGVFDNARPMPNYPSKIAVVTSLTGAALQDVLSIAKKRNPLVQMIVVPAVVQGENAPQSIKNAIELANKIEDLEIIICCRGGGASEDLDAFNTESVAIAVFNSQIPVVSAIGHETDITLCDFAADLRAQTPSAAVQMVMPSLANMKSNLSSIVKKMNFGIEYKMQKNYTKRAVLRQKVATVNYAVFGAISAKKAELLSKIELIESLSPLNILKRGYTLALSQDGTPIKEGKNLQSGDILELKFSDISRKIEVL